MGHQPGPGQPNVALVARGLHRPRGGGFVVALPIAILALPCDGLVRLAASEQGAVLFLSGVPPLSVIWQDHMTRSPGEGA